MSKVNSASKVEFQSFDTLFGSNSVDFKRDESEKVTEVDLSELCTFKDHPFRVLDDAKMEETVDSIRKYGVLNPALVRPRAGGGYELLSGHRRKRGSELAGLTSMPVIIREISDDEAVIIMVDSNIQREDLLFSEKAFAYKMKNDAMKHQGSKGNKNTADIIAENTGESGRTIQRYIRLTYLINELLELVDQKKLTFGAGVDLSYLKEEEQVWILEYIQANEAYPTPQQSDQLKQYSSQEKLTADIVQLLLENHKPVPRKVVIKQDRLAGYFEKEYTSKQIEEIIFQLLDEWSNKQR
ncbi:ParB/RepB/Spo0J family partition protein, partial [Anaerosporobacter sp.]|uniref:ParB/RepB/Spo0J family partition protein n=1 Tax=Anaerosporobacter sp. TaxID=1872529 RepID=UPI00289DFC01